MADFGSARVAGGPRLVAGSNQMYSTPLGRKREKGFVNRARGWLLLEIG